NSLPPLNSARTILNPAGRYVSKLSILDGRDPEGGTSEPLERWTRSIAGEAIKLARSNFRRVSSLCIGILRFNNGVAQEKHNFGKAGERPTHLELFDYLANSFIEGGWSIKSMHVI